MRWVFKIVFLLVQPDNCIRNFKLSLFTCQHPHFHEETNSTIINLQTSVLCCIFSTLSPVATRTNLRGLSQKCFSSQWFELRWQTRARPCLSVGTKGTAESLSMPIFRMVITATAVTCCSQRGSWGSCFSCTSSQQTRDSL